MHGTREWRPPTRKGRCRHPHETPPPHQLRPPWKDGRYGKLEAGVTGSAHGNPPQRTQPKTNTAATHQQQPHRGAPNGYDAEPTQRPCLGRASGGHNEPGSRLAFTGPVQPPSRSEGASPQGAEGHHGIGRADRSTESNRTGRGTAPHAGPQGTPQRHAAGHNQGTPTGAKQQPPPGAANPGSVHNTQRATARGQVRGTTQPTHHKPQPGLAAYVRGLLSR